MENGHLILISPFPQQLHDVTPSGDAERKVYELWITAPESKTCNFLYPCSFKIFFTPTLACYSIAMPCLVAYVSILFSPNRKFIKLFGISSEFFSIEFIRLQILPNADAVNLPFLC